MARGKNKLNEVEKKFSGYDVRNVSGKVFEDVDKIITGKKEATSIYSNDTITDVVTQFIEAGHDTFKARRLSGFCVSVAVGVSPSEAYLRCLAEEGKHIGKSPESMANAYMKKYPLINQMINKLSAVFHRKLVDEALKGYKATASEVLSGIRDIINESRENGDLKTALRGLELLGKTACLWDSKGQDANIVINNNIPKRDSLANVDIMDLNKGKTLELSSNEQEENIEDNI